MEEQATASADTRAEYSFYPGKCMSEVNSLRSLFEQLSCTLGYMPVNGQRSGGTYIITP